MYIEESKKKKKERKMNRLRDVSFITFQHLNRKFILKKKEDYRRINLVQISDPLLLDYASQHFN